MGWLLRSMRKIFHFNHGTGDHNPRLIYFISKHSVPSQNLIMREPLHDMHATDCCERHQVRVRTKGLHSCPADSEVGVNDSAPVQVDLDCDEGIYSNVASGRCFWNKRWAFPQSVQGSIHTQANQVPNCSYRCWFYRILWWIMAVQNEDVFSEFPTFFTQFHMHLTQISLTALCFG